MTTRMMLAVGLVAVAGVLAVAADAQAGKRKRNRGCNDCGGAAVVHAAPGCGGCCGHAMAGVVGGYAALPEAMPATGTAVRPAAGTDTGAVVPAGGTVTNPTVVVPAGAYLPGGGYYLNGVYVYPAGGTTVTPPGVFQGVIGSPTMYYGNNPGGGRRGGIFRR